MAVALEELVDEAVGDPEDNREAETLWEGAGDAAVAETEEVGELDAATDTLANSDALCVADEEPLTALAVALVDGDGDDESVKEDVLLPLPAGVPLRDADGPAVIDTEAEELEEPVEEAVGDSEDEKEAKTLWVELAEAAGEKLVLVDGAGDDDCEIELDDDAAADGLAAVAEAVGVTDALGVIDALRDGVAAAEALSEPENEATGVTL